MAQCADTNSCIEVNDLKMHFMLKSGLFSKPKVLKAVEKLKLSVLLPISYTKTICHSIIILNFLYTMVSY